MKVALNENSWIATKAKREQELISDVSIIFRDLRIICIENLYFTIIYLKMYFLDKYISLILALVRLSSNYINSFTCKSGGKIANEIPNVVKIGISK